MNVAYLGEGRFSEEQDLHAMLVNAGGTDINIAKHDLAGYPALEVAATVGDRHIRMLYMALNVDSNVLHFDYRHPRPNSDADSATWRNFIDGFAVQRRSRWDRGRDSSEVLSLALARFWFLRSYTARLQLTTRMGPEHAEVRPEVHQTCVIQAHDGELIHLSTDLRASNRLSYRDGNARYEETISGGGVFGPGVVRVRDEILTLGDSAAEKIKLKSPEAEPTFNGLCVLAGFPLICQSTFEQFLGAQFSYYDLRVADEVDGRVILEGSLLRDRAASELARGRFSANQIQTTLERIAVMQVFVRSDTYQWECTQVSGRYDQYPMQTTQRLLGLETPDRMNFTTLLSAKGAGERPWWRRALGRLGRR